mmetsp:Transcript_57073/g.101942  ORF Transcript_57073/g.101942 Transcript_57073/m.101942 type:complete len:219 (+) Transcript_57073:4425-5081(+)
MLAVTQAARGAAATEARLMTSGLKELGFWSSSFWTFSRVSTLMLCASNSRMLCTIPRWPRNFLMLIQDVSKMPITDSTASSTSRIASGGIFRARISFRFSALICPTASRAASNSGCTPASCFSMSEDLPPSSLLSTPSWAFSASASFFCSEAFSMATWISSRALSACSCLAASCTFWAAASRARTSTDCSASFSLARPDHRRLRWSKTCLCCVLYVLA